MKRTRPYLMAFYALALNLVLVLGYAPRVSAQEPLSCSAVFTVSFSSNNPGNSAQAVPGDIVTLSITTGFSAITVTGVNFGTTAAVVNQINPNSWTASFTVLPTTPLGIVSGTIFANFGTQTCAPLPFSSPGFTVIAPPPPTTQIIGNFMLNRANLLAGAQPNIIPFVDGSNTGGSDQPGEFAMTSTEQGMTLAFSTSRSKIMAAAAANRLALAFGSAEGTDNSEADKQISVSTNDTLFDRQGTWDIWTEVYGSMSSSGASDTTLWVGYLGTHYFVSPNMIIGLLGQLDWAEETNSTLASNADGMGWMIGPYIAGRVPNQNLYYEARASWGRSDNDVSPIGTYTDSFETERWMASAKVSGSYAMGEYTIKPAASIAYFEETQESYTDTSPVPLLIPSQTVSLGEVRFGPSLERAIELADGTIIRPSVGVSGVLNFGIQNNVASQGFAFGNSDLRARFDAGFNSTNPMGWILTASGFYDGVGIDNYYAYGGTARLTIPLN